MANIITVHNLSSGKTFNVPCTPDITSFTINKFCELVSDKIGINLQFISAEGVSMNKGTSTLERYGVGPGSMIYANSLGNANQVDSASRVTVRVHTQFSTMTHNVDIDQFDTLEILKLKVWGLSNIPAHEQRIQLQGLTIDSGLLVDIVNGNTDLIFDIFHETQTKTVITKKLVRNWYFLEGNQSRPIDPSQWHEYDSEVSFQLNQAYEDMLSDGREGPCLLLDLAAFTDPPAPYQVWVGRPAVVSNPREVPGSTEAVCGERFGKNSVAGFDISLWQNLDVKELPLDLTAGIASVSKLHCYQVRSTHVGLLNQLTSYLEDTSGSHALDLPKQVARRAVLVIERPNFFTSPVHQPPPPQRAAAEHTERGGEAVWQWWWGDARSSSSGHWKSYHSDVQRRLESLWASSGGVEILDVDATRYQLQHVTEEHPFDYVGQTGFRENFLPRDVLTLGSTAFDDTRDIGECFVQFHRSNPHRRRAARRIPPAERRTESQPSPPEGSPCSLCFSEVGSAMRCEHFACNSCLRRSIRIFSIDSTKSQGLICGCYSITDREALRDLAIQSDSSLQALIADGPPTDEAERAEYEEEISSSRDLLEGGETAIPADLYAMKVRRWFAMMDGRGLEDLFIACSFPACSMENWILKSDFEAELGHGVRSWRCKAGHNNTVLPTSVEIDDMNRNLLSHPEFYTKNCMYDSQALRRYRLCKECIGLGKLVLAVHGGACKQWPGGGASVRTHEHCFCFNCGGKWNVECRHNKTCTDLGVQQVRLIQGEDGREQLELGFVDGAEYLRCLTRSSCAFPDTVFPSGRVNGESRQRHLGMEDRRALYAEMSRGTS